MPPFNRVAVLLTGPCNYRCFYCRVHLSRRDGVPFGPFSTAEGADRLLATLDIMGQSSVSLVGAGEVMLLPNFIDLCRGIAQRHCLGITTNLSRPVQPFIEAVPPEKVSSFVISLHPQAEADLATFQNKAVALRKAGYPATVIYVAHPLRLRKVPPLFRYFTGRSIPFKVAPFNGAFRGARYPSAYKPKEIEFLLPYVVDPLSRYALSGRTRCHAGKLCAAGHSSFAIYEQDGRIQRCQNVPQVHGNVFSGTFAPLARPAPCPAPLCHCDVCLEEQVFLKRYYAKFARGALPPVSDATMKEYEAVCAPLRGRTAAGCPNPGRAGIPLTSANRDGPP